MTSLAAAVEVFTLEDAATYLRLPSETVARQAAAGRLPGREVEGSWRFLKSALDDWLGRRDLRSALVAQAGALAEDESLEALRASIYQARGRSEI